MQGRCNNINVYVYRTGMVITNVIFLFCKDDSEMLRLSKKLSNFSMMFTEKCHSCKPPNEHTMFLVECSVNQQNTV
jgi:hypothetical protein